MRRTVAWVAFLAWAAVVWALSSSSDPARDVDWPWAVPDKLAHGVEFGVGGWLGRAAFAAAPVGRATSAAVVACAAWGAVDEIHQGSVPGRETDPWDLVADVTGATLGAFLHAWTRRERGVRARPSR